jgi:hypothetical protein
MTLMYESLSLLAAMLASTDAALGKAVNSNAAVPADVRMRGAKKKTWAEKPPTCVRNRMIYRVRPSGRRPRR